MVGGEGPCAPHLSRKLLSVPCAPRVSYKGSLQGSSQERDCCAHLRAVVWMSRQDGRRPVELLQKHDAYHLMRPGRSPKSDPDLFLGAQFGRKSVRAADHEHGVWDRLIPPAAKAQGQVLTSNVLAAFVHSDKHGVWRDCGGYRCGCHGTASWRVAGTGVAALIEMVPATAELAA